MKTEEFIVEIEKTAQELTAFLALDGEESIQLLEKFE